MGRNQTHANGSFGSKADLRLMTGMGGKRTLQSRQQKFRRGIHVWFKGHPAFSLQF